MSSPRTANVIRLDDFRERDLLPIKPDIIEKEPTTSSRNATLDDLYDTSGDNSSFAGTARSRFASLASSLVASRGADPLDRDEAIMMVQVELPHSFALNGWSDGALSIITALSHALRNNRGRGLDESQYFRVLEAVNALRDFPAIRLNRALDFIDALQDSGLNTDPEEAEQLQTVIDD